MSEEYWEEDFRDYLIWVKTRVDQDDEQLTETNNHESCQQDNPVTLNTTS